MVNLSNALAALSVEASSVYAALKADIEYREGEWGVVYLDNARPAGMSVTSFRGYLGVLAKAGVYKVVDGYAWGMIRTK